MAKSITRKARTVWRGDLKRGEGRVTTQSGTLSDSPVTVPGRLGPGEEQTNPEELIAAAHASCFAMASVFFLSQQGLEPVSLDVQAALTIEPETERTYRVDRVELHAEGVVPGADPDAFAAALEEAKSLCPVSRMFADTVTISLTQTLFPSADEVEIG